MFDIKNVMTLEVFTPFSSCVIAENHTCSFQFSSIYLLISCSHISLLQLEAGSCQTGCLSTPNLAY